MSEINTVVEATTEAAEVATDAVKAGSGLGKYNKFGYGALAGLGLAGLTYGGIKLGKYLIGKHKAKKAAEAPKPAPEAAPTQEDTQTQE